MSVFKLMRIVVLLSILFVIVVGTWMTEKRMASWDRPLLVTIYPIIADDEAVTERFVMGLDERSFEPVNRFFEREMRPYGFTVTPAIRFQLAEPRSELPPVVPDRILSFLTSVTESRVLFLAGLNLFLLAVGCAMDIFSAIVIVVPIMVPIALSYGIDPIHLCVIFLVNLEIGYSTPPVGINLFISSLKFEKPLTLLYRASLPYLVLLMAALLVIT